MLQLMFLFFRNFNDIFAPSKMKGINFFNVTKILRHPNRDTNRNEPLDTFDYNAVSFNFFLYMHVFINAIVFCVRDLFFF